MPRMWVVSPRYSETTDLLPMRVPATLFKRVKRQRYIVKMLFWLRPGACHYLQCPLNSSHKHVFKATFSLFFWSCFFLIFDVCRRRRRSSSRDDSRRRRGGAIAATTRVEPAVPSQRTSNYSKFFQSNYDFVRICFVFFSSLLFDQVSQSLNAVLYVKICSPLWPCTK